MNTIPGNPHAKDAEFSTEAIHDWMGDEGVTDATMLAATIEANAQATLALAYEQRTANLIEWCREDARIHPDVIAGRLGLQGEARA